MRRLRRMVDCIAGRGRREIRTYVDGAIVWGQMSLRNVHLNWDIDGRGKGPKVRPTWAAWRAGREIGVEALAADRYIQTLYILPIFARRYRSPTVPAATFMRFSLIDKITELKPGESVTAEKYLTGDEEYLRDHFPNFPCMPGVLMLEAMYQAGAWLLRQSDSFARPIVLMKEVRNVKYGSFVAPGQTLIVHLQVQKVDGSLTKLKGQGTVDGKQAVSGILLLDQFRHSDRYEIFEAADPISRREYLAAYRKLIDQN